MRAVCSFAALALMLFPALASAAPATTPPTPAPAAKAHAGHPRRTARIQKKAEAKTCLKPAIEVVAGGESSTFSLARCDGTPAPLAVDQLSILARPGSAAKPKVTVDALARSHGSELAPGIRRIDARLVERLETAIDHFHKSGQPSKVLLVSGYRPKSTGSYHQSGRAIDFRIDGVQNEALVAFCKTLPDTGCGYYPNSSFVHMDVRDAGAGHVAWIDVSRPGEAPKYVTAWPVRGESADEASKLPDLPVDEQRRIGTEETKGRRLDRHPYVFWDAGVVVDDDEEAQGLGASLTLNGRDYARLRVGEERPPGESPCAGCGSYYFTLHAVGCEDEQCPACGGQLATCGCR